MSPIIKWTLIAIVGVTSSLTVHFSTVFHADQSFKGVYVTIAMVIFAMSILFGLRAVKNENEHDLPFEKGIKSAMQIVVFTSLFVGIYLYFFFTFVNPGDLEKMIAQQLVEIEKLTIPIAQKEEMIKSTEKMYSPFNQANMQVLLLVFVGSLFSLISTILVRKVRTA